MISSRDLCECRVIHEDKVHRAINDSLHPEETDNLCQTFKALGDKTRLTILWALEKQEMCVCDLCALLKMKQPAVSHQLKNLKQARIVRSRREGKVIFYSLDDEHIEKLLNLGMAHIKEQ